MIELRRESLLRKKASNRVRELCGNIRVFARIRPVHTDERITLQRLDEFTCELEMRALAVDGSRRESNGACERRKYEFDACFGPQASQAEIFEQVHAVFSLANSLLRFVD